MPHDAWPSSAALLLASARLPFAHLTVSRTLYYWWLDSQGEQDTRLVSEFIRAQRGRLVIERLPGYAPELNPVEYIWGYWKQHALPNFCPRDFGQLSYQARRALRRMRRRPRLVRAFWRQAELSL